MSLFLWKMRNHYNKLHKRDWEKFAFFLSQQDYDLCDFLSIKVSTVIMFCIITGSSHY